MLGFDNLTGNPGAGWLAAALAEFLTLELAADSGLRIVPAPEVTAARADLGITDDQDLSSDEIARIRSRLACDQLLVGAYRSGADDTVLLELRLVDTATGDSHPAGTQTGTTSQFLDLVSRTALGLRRELGLVPLAAERATGARTLPSQPRAARLYAEGVARLRGFDALAARELLERAIEADPDYPLAYSALAEAWGVLGYDARARQAAERAFELSPGLPRQERLFVEGRYREAVRQWDRAIRIYQTLFRLFPDDPDYAFRLAATQASAGHGGDAMATLDNLRAVHGPGRLDTRVDFEEARAANAWGDFERALRAAQRAAERARVEGARLLEAQARLQEGYALRTLGRADQAIAAGDRAYELFSQAGDRSGQARALLENAGVERYQGNVAQARRLAEQALALARLVGDQSAIAGAANRIASVDREQGRLATAERMYSLSLDVAREIGERDQQATALNNLGLVSLYRGRLEAAEASLRECIALSESVGHVRGLAYGHFNLGFVLFERGDLQGARRAHEEALKRARQAGDEGLEATALTGLARIAFAQADFATARRVHEQALEKRLRVGSLGYVAESRMFLGQVDLAQDEPARAEARLREALGEFERENAVPNRAAALALLSRALLAQGRHADAGAAADTATTLMTNSEADLLRDSVAIEVAPVRAQQAEPSRTVRQLDDVRRRARGSGWVAKELECRLVLGRLERRYGDPIAAAPGLAALARDAAARGFVRIASAAAEGDAARR